MGSQVRQATGPSGASGKLRHAPRKTHPKKSPDDEAPVYRQLAAAAHSGGFPGITPARIHGWVGVGLLPRTSVRTGAFPFASELRPGIEDQLLALCRLARSTTSRSSLAALLWADGWEVDLDLLKDALLSYLPSRSLSTATDEELDDFDRAISARVSAFMRLVRPGRAQAATSDALAALGPLLYGASDSLDNEAATAIERVAGVHRARVDWVGAATPWLVSEPAEAFNLLLGAESWTSSRAYLAGLDSAGLAESRTHARFLMHELPEFARGIEALLGRGFGGLRWFARMLPRDAPMMALAAVLVGRDPRLVANLDAMIASLASIRDSMRLAIDLAAEYADRHPDQRAALRRYGLQGLADRGRLSLS